MNPLIFISSVYNGKAVFLVCSGLIVIIFMVVVIIFSGISKNTINRRVPSVIIAVVSILVLSFLSGFVSSSSNKISYPEFENGEGSLSSEDKAPFILLSKSSNGFILGRCDAYDKDFVLIPYDEKIKFRRVKDDGKINFYRHCFDDAWNLTF